MPISIIAIHDVSSQILSSILDTAYHEGDKLDSPPALVLLKESTRVSLHQYTQDSVTLPPIEVPFTSPFIGWSPSDVTKFRLGNAKGTSIETNVFLLADERTTKDGTMMLVRIDETEQDNAAITLESLRVTAEFVNTQAVCVSVAVMSVGELIEIADDYGVFRGGPRRSLIQKGSKAPREQLAGLGNIQT